LKFNALKMNSALKKVNLVKVWGEDCTTPKIKVVSNLCDYFNLSKETKRMDYLAEAKEEQKKYWDKVIEDGFDFHYFKKQTFSKVYPRLVCIINNYLF
jgi:hypothetical protein